MPAQILLRPVSPESVVLGLIGAAAVVAGYCLFRLYAVLNRRRGAPLPPGPPGEPLLGHYRVVPTDAAFKKYAEWGKQYSTLCSLNMLLCSGLCRGLLRAVLTQDL